jgi:thiamine biosynthesis lipoprotein
MVINWCDDIVVDSTDTYKLLHFCGMKYLFSMLLAVVVLLVSCAEKRDYRQYQGNTMGTRWQIKFNPSDNAPETTQIEKLLADYNQVLSTYIPESGLSLFNASDSGVSFEGTAYQWMDALWQASIGVHKRSKGAFDPSASAIFNLWGFGEKEGSTPDSSLIDSLMSFSGMHQFNWENQFLRKDDPRASLNFNAIAKGYGVDVICNLLDSFGLDDYFVEIGGELRCKGVNEEGVPWTIGINRPEEGSSTRSVFSAVRLSNRAIATSGNYRNYVKKDGKKWAHTINPKTGFPVESDVLSASIVAPDCMQADALATACMVMGREACLEMINNMEHVEAFLIGSDLEGAFTEHFSTGMPVLMVDL